jgi:hypothetical protein
MNKPEGEDTTGVNHEAQRLRVPGAESRQRSRLSREATGRSIARTAITPGRKAAPAEEVGEVTAKTE